MRKLKNLQGAASRPRRWYYTRRWITHKVKDCQINKHEPIIIPRSEHGISRSNISENAIKVLYRLNKADYAAFLVGGAVRDLLLGKHPKDFDIATDASPEQVHDLFRNSRMIGRRFRIVHVRYGREIIEVTTFRGTHDDAHEGIAHQNDDGRLLRDNVYGDIDSDAWRRDLTVNALFYNIKDFSVVDFVGGELSGDVCPDPGECAFAVSSAGAVVHQNQVGID